MTDTQLNAPWALRFDRDGTEDVGTIVDANGNALVTSRPFWLPEGGNPVPPTLVALTLMKAAPKLYQALEDLLEQTTEQDLKHGIPLSEGETVARDEALAALAEAAGSTTERRKYFGVEVIVRTREVYRVSAPTAEAAEDEWWDGQLVETDDDLDNEILSVEEECEVLEDGPRHGLTRG